MAKTGASTHPEFGSARYLMAELESLRGEVRAQKPDLTAKRAGALAERITRDAIAAMVERGEISFVRYHPDR